MWHFALTFVELVALHVGLSKGMADKVSVRFSTLSPSVVNALWVGYPLSLVRSQWTLYRAVLNFVLMSAWNRNSRLIPVGNNTGRLQMVCHR
jgi:hypothetical protein